MSDTRENILRAAILGDSRTFDTYYVNEFYRDPYGYDATFPALLRPMGLRAARPMDFIHIPDHFRGGSTENNIIRLALTNPHLCILCDGIWETLLNKDMYLEFVTKSVRDHDFMAGAPISFTYSGSEMLGLFLDGKLSLSPGGYAARIGEIASYFLRRRRAVTWMNLVVPPVSHLRHAHYAGNFRCIPEWGACLDAVNKAVAERIVPLGGRIMDVNALAAEHGPIEQTLIDQWHFSRSFHAFLADRIAGTADRFLPDADIGDDHISHRFMLAGARLGKDPVAVWGAGAASKEWIAKHRDVDVVAVIADEAAPFFYSIPTCTLETLPSLPSGIVIVPDGAVSSDEERYRLEAQLIERLPDRWIILREREETLVNPRGSGARELA
ncbi:MAG: hypothetical protein AB7G39_01955 [Alphaproteobacteria bacterium]